MKTKFLTLIGVVIAVALAMYFLAGDDGEQERARQIAQRQIADRQDRERKERSDDTERSDDGVPSDRDDDPIKRLTELVIAEKSNALGDWTVAHRDGRGTLTFPFKPQKNGQLPDVVSKTGTSQPVETDFVGAAACKACHDDKHSGFIHTAHHQTSGTTNNIALDGKFEEPGNTLNTRDSGLSFRVTRDDEGYVQTAMIGDWQQQVPLDVFTGSAKTGRTFLYWKGDALFQSHVSYLSGVDEWIPSPGFDASRGDYTRRIRSACLECHMTYIQSKPGSNRYHKDTALWGVSCERCHGAGGPHVRFHEQNPNEKEAHAITHPRDLSRQRQLQICGQCHSGSFSLLGDAFSFRPGDELAKFHKPKNTDFKGVGGIHTSNQLTRLSMSECFKQSEMTCTTCHDPHVDQRDNLKAFTAKCLECHQVEACGLSEKLGEKIRDDCVSCHMPVGENVGMTLEVSEGSLTINMIDHYIRVIEK